MLLTTKDTQKNIEFDDQIFDYFYNEDLIHQAVTAFLNDARSGTAAQKTRAEVRGGGKKPWRQKGTGRARAGTIRSPLWRGGGVIFAAKPRDYSQKLNKKMYRRAIRSIISEINRKGSLVVLSEFKTESHKTKAFIEKMQSMNIESALIILTELNQNEFLASRNLPEYAICEVDCIDPYHLIKYPNIVITEDALKQLEKNLQ